METTDKIIRLRQIIVFPVVDELAATTGRAAESLTPDAALLEEADTLPTSFVRMYCAHHRTTALAVRLAQALRASLDREREMQKDLTDAQQQVEVLQPGGTYAWKNHAEQAERERDEYKHRLADFCREYDRVVGERDALAAELQRLKEGK